MWQALASELRSSRGHVGMLGVKQRHEDVLDLRDFALGEFLDLEKTGLRGRQK